MTPIAPEGSGCPHQAIAAAKATVGCPVKHDVVSKDAQADGCPVKHDVVSKDAQADGCPVDKEARSGMMEALGISSGNGKPVGQGADTDTSAKATHNTPANDMAFGQDRYPGQRIPLSRHRAASTIPNDDFVPAHQPEGTKEWVYPSEQQYYNAMKRKGYNPDEGDVPVILAIHNTVNERGWSQLKDWEHMRGCDAPKLKRFMGRPKDISPKAYIKSFMGYSLPFDRHDWIVDSNGTETRYVIDFYKGSTQKAIQDQAGRAVQGNKLPMPVIAMHLDVRPAVDSPTTALLRLRVFLYRMMGMNPFQGFGGSKPPATTVGGTSTGSSSTASK